MKRRDLIALASLKMFNEVGEANLAAIDIANELDISPGNLYYHYKGKSQIIAELFKNLSLQLNELLDMEIADEDPLIEGFLHFYVMLELFYDYRFFFRNVSDIDSKYPDTGSKLIKLVKKLHGTICAGVMGLSSKGILAISPEDKETIERMANNVLLVLLYWESYCAVFDGGGTRGEYVQSAGLQILAQSAPLLPVEQLMQLQVCHQSYMESNYLGLA